MIVQDIWYRCSNTKPSTEFELFCLGVLVYNGVFAKMPKQLQNRNVCGFTFCENKVQIIIATDIFKEV